MSGVPYSSTNVTSVTPSTFVFAQTALDEPGGSTPLINVNFRFNNLTLNTTWQFTGLPTGDEDWQLFDRWSTVPGFLFTELSPQASITLLTTGFLVDQTSYYRAESILHLKSQSTDTRNIAMQIGRKRNGTWERIGTPAISGHIKMNNSGASNTVTVSISEILSCIAGDEIGLFTTRVGEAGTVTAIRHTSKFSVQKL